MAGKSGKGATVALNLLLSALAGASVAFAIFAMPDWRLAQAVDLSGLPLLLPAAQPPLGGTARLAVMALAAAAAFLLVWLVLRALDKPARTRPAKPTEPIEVAMRLRRADRHPDAPAPRPLFAGADLGSLDHPVSIEEDERQEHDTAFDLFEAPETFQIPDEPLQDAADMGQTSIPHLMQRLELGLLRRERDPWSEAVGEASVAEPEQRNALDERLRSAIDDLQKLTTRP